LQTRKGNKFLSLTLLIIKNLVFIAVLICLSACVNKKDQSELDLAEEADRAKELQRLLSLPYLGFSEEKAKEDVDGVIMHDEERSYPGYNLYSVRNFCTAKLIDNLGNIVRSWKYQPCGHWSNCKILPNGDLLVVGTDHMDSSEDFPKPEFRYILRYSWDGKLIWKRSIWTHHDIELTPHFQILVLTQRYRLVPAIDPAVEILDNELTLLSLRGALLDVCSLYDLFRVASSHFSFKHIRIKVGNKKKLIDLLHANSIEWMHHSHLEKQDPIYAANNILVCSRHQDVIAIIDWEEKKIVWTWGRGVLSAPHDATVLENGHILVFDNGVNRGWSRVIEVNPLAKKIVWEYRAPNPKDFFTRAAGSSQRLPNGNTLIANSNSGHAFEVTPNGEVVWEFFNPIKNAKGYRGTIIRMKRYGLSYIHGIMKWHGE